MNEKKVLTVSVRKRNGLVFSGMAESVSSYNDKGPFDILPLHANFVSIIKNNLKIETSSGRMFQIPVDRGVLRVRKDDVEIFLGV